MRPLIGITTYREEASWGIWTQSADLLPTPYAVAIESADGIPVLLPPPSSPDRCARDASAVVARLDGLVIAGGADVEPSRYGAEPHTRTVRWAGDRDGWELALLDAADVRGLPVLGICRGMQLMAVHGGGSLHQHTPEVTGTDLHDPGGDRFGDVEVAVAVGSRLRTLLGDRQQVGCHHHQSVDAHPGYAVAAAAADGTLESIERPGDRFVLGVQWHPETREDAGLFRGLVAAALRGPVPPDCP